MMNQRIVLCLFSFVLLAFSACTKADDLGVSSKEELEAKLRKELEGESLTSIAYSIVKDGQLLYSGALGYADKGNNKLATDETLYLIASVSKTVTAVALMQLVEQGSVALDDDINAFLPFSVRNPNYPNIPITYRMLLSHTSSISDRHQDGLDLDCYGIDCPMTLEAFFEHVFIPTGQYFSANNFSNKKPGTKEDYSNLATALVGYLVERIAQTPFDAYCENNIFAPLGMTKTAWRLSSIPVSELAIPYSPDITSPNPHYTFPDYPNGGLRTNVLDLSKLLRVFIQDGTLDGVQVLSAESTALMKTLQFGSADQCLSLYYETINGKRMLGHSGGEKGATAEMYFDPNVDTGVIVFNNDDDAALDNIVTLLFNYAEKQ